MGRGEVQTQSEFPAPLRGPHKASMLYGERRKPDTVGIFRLRKMELCVWYSDEELCVWYSDEELCVWYSDEELCVWCFDDLHDWGKRSCPQPQTIYSEFP